MDDTNISNFNRTINGLYLSGNIASGHEGIFWLDVMFDELSSKIGSDNARAAAEEYAATFQRHFKEIEKGLGIKSTLGSPDQLYPDSFTINFNVEQKLPEGRKGEIQETILANMLGKYCEEVHLRTISELDLKHAKKLGEGPGQGHGLTP